MQHRYYIGFQLPKELSERIAKAQQALFEPTLPKPLEPHITLLPPPAVERVEPEELARQAKITAEPFWPLRLMLHRIALYSEHTLAISVKSEEIYKLQKQLMALLPPDIEVTYHPNPKFTPHVTLTRARRGEILPAGLQQRYEQELAGLLPATFEVRGLTLFRWVEPQTYEALPL